MTPVDRELAEAARMHEWLREVDAVQAPGAYNDSDGVASSQPDTIAQQRHLGLLPRVPLRCPGVDG